MQEEPWGGWRSDGGGRKGGRGLGETKESSCSGHHLNFASFLFFNLGLVLDRDPVGMKLLTHFYTNK